MYAAKLDREQLAEVCSIMQKTVFQPGERLMAEGESGDTFFVMSGGTARVTMAEKFVRDLTAGDSFGEIALIYNQPRTATITATTLCTP
jgi:CRP-like cAMP-binding protein